MQVSATTLNYALRTAAAFGVLLASATDAQAVAPPLCSSTNAGACEGALTASGGRIPYYRNYSLSTNTTITRAVIMIHGHGRDSRSAFSAAVAAANDHGTTTLATTLIIVPHFQREVDAASGELYWGEGWKEGGQSSDPSRMSSFEVMDEIFDKLNNRTTFPNLAHVTLAGHSAGGQFVNRYTAGGLGEVGFLGDVRYVSANPGSYLYLNGTRPNLADEFSFISGTSYYTPEWAPNTLQYRQWCATQYEACNGAESTCYAQFQTCLAPYRNPHRCVDFNEYKYGLTDRNTYMSQFTTAEIVERFESRDFRLLLGTADTSRASDDFDDSCEADAQGENRLMRGRWYQRYIDTIYPDAQITRSEISGVGHDGRAMFRSVAGRNSLFSW